MIWTWRWNCTDTPAAAPAIPPGTGTLILDWQWACNAAAPPPLTAVNVCVACNVAIAVRVLSPGDTGAINQVAGQPPAAPAPPVPAVPPALEPVPFVAGVTSESPAALDTAAPGADGGPAAASSSAPRVAPSQAAAVQARLHAVGLPPSPHRTERLPGLPAASVLPTRFTPSFPVEARSLAPLGLDPTARALRTRAPAPRRTPAPAEHRAPSAPQLPAAPPGAVAAAAFAGASHGGHAGSSGNIVLLAILLASLADLSRRLVPRRLRLVASASPGRLERPG